MAVQPTRGIWPNVAVEVLQLARKVTEGAGAESPLIALTRDLIGGTASYRMWYAWAAPSLTEKQAGRLYLVCGQCGNGVGGPSLDRRKRPDGSGWDHSACHGGISSGRKDNKYDKAEHRAAVHHAITTGQRLA